MKYTYHADCHELWATTSTSPAPPFQLQVRGPSAEVLENAFIVSNRDQWNAPVDILPDLSAHLVIHLITPGKGFVSQTLERAAAELNVSVPPNLWHAYLFYFSGKVCQQLLREHGLADYELYMIRNQVFGSYIPYLENYLPAYLKEDTTLLTASTDLIRSFYEDQD